MKKGIVLLAVASLLATACVYDRDYGRRYPVEHSRQDQRRNDHQYEPARPPEREYQQERENIQHRSRSEQRRDDDHNEQRREDDHNEQRREYRN